MKKNRLNLFKGNIVLVGIWGFYGIVGINIKISSDKVIISYFGKKIILTKNQISNIKRSNYPFPFIKVGIRFYHKNKSYPKRIIFVSYGSTAKIIKSLKKSNYKISE